MERKILFRGQFKRPGEADNIQVVGNVYDTPELLADCQKEEDRIVEG